MNKQDFILTELEAIGKDIEAIVKQGRDQMGREEMSTQEMEERQRELKRLHRRSKGVIGTLARMYDPNKLIPELAYIETRLRAVQSYIFEGTAIGAHTQI